MTPAAVGLPEHRPGVVAYADVNFALVAQMLERAPMSGWTAHEPCPVPPAGLDIGYN